MFTKAEHKTQQAPQIFNQKESPNQNNSTSKVKITENEIGKVWRTKTYVKTMVTKPENLFLSLVFLAVTPCSVSCEYSAQDPSQKAPQAIVPPLFPLQKFAPLLSRFFSCSLASKLALSLFLFSLSKPSFPLFWFFSVFSLLSQTACYL